MRLSSLRHQAKVSEQLGFERNLTARRDKVKNTSNENVKTDKGLRGWAQKRVLTPDLKL